MRRRSLKFLFLINVIMLNLAPESEASIAVDHVKKITPEKQQSKSQSIDVRAIAILVDEIEKAPTVALKTIESHPPVERKQMTASNKDIGTIDPEQGLSIEDLALSALLDEIEDAEVFPEELIGVAEELDLPAIASPQNDPPTDPQIPTLTPRVHGPRLLPENVAVTYDIPIVHNALAGKYITLFQTRLRPHFEKWLARSGRYTEMMREILRDYQLPEDLVYLALIESGFNPKAFSRSRASGTWQFIKGTGKKYGLQIDRWIDERRDPVAATHAAANYLRDLYALFDSWPLALAGYNAGEGRVARAIKRTKTKDFWKLRKSRLLHRETKNYVPKFMAATMIAKNPKKYGFDVTYHTPWEYDEVEIAKAAYLSSIAKNAGISLKELRKYNPQIKRDVTPPRMPGYRIKLPKGKGDIFLANYSPDEEEDLVIGRSFKHRVRRGETITSIARRYGVSIRRLLETNGLKPRSIIRTGQYILVNDGWRGGDDKHRIRRGETISTIAVKYNVPMRHLLEVNQLHKKSIIRTGDTLIIPEIRKHTIRRGETIGAIARKYTVRTQDLLRANRLKKGNFIREGRTLIIP
ncbi:MAG: LysM peptidoglycan-binding domain-containing protein [Nitrospiria bacterium]